MIEDIIARHLIIIINGLFRASTLFLLGTGLSIIYGTLNLLNLAHAAFLTLGAFVAASVIQGVIGALSLGPVATGFIFLILLFVIVPLAVAAVGAGLEFTIFQRLYGLDDTYQLLATFGLILILDDAMRFIWGGNPVSAPAPATLLGSISIFGRTYPTYPLVAILITVVVAAGLYYFFEYTRLGKLTLAMAEDAEILRAVGINTRRIHLQIFLIGVALAGLGGALWLPNASVTTGLTFEFVILAFAVLVIGGLGSLKGAIAASLLIGLIRSYGTAYVPELALAIVFLLMAVVMLIKPTGLYGAMEA